MKKTIVLLVALCLAVSGAFASQSVFLEKDVALGTSMVMMPGHEFYGLNFQKWIGNTGIDLEAGGTYSEGPYSEQNLNASIKLQASLFESPAGERTQVRIYTWLLAGVMGDGFGRWEDDPENPGETQWVTDFGVDYCGGFGFGAEVVLWKSLSIPVEFGFSGGFPHEKAFGYSFSTGLRYRL